jgi:Ca-activated chloride channel homolog
MTNYRPDQDPNSPERPESLGQPSVEERLTAYLFDELDDAARLKIEQELAADPALQTRLNELRETVSMLHRSAFEAVPERLDESRRAELRAAAVSAAGGQADPAHSAELLDAERRPKGTILHFPWLKAVAAMLVVSAGVYLLDPGAVPGVNSDASTEASLAAESEHLAKMGYLDDSSTGEAFELKSQSADQPLLHSESLDQRGHAKESLVETEHQRDALRKEFQDLLLRETGYMDLESETISLGYVDVDKAAKAAKAGVKALKAGDTVDPASKNGSIDITSGVAFDSDSWSKALGRSADGEYGQRPDRGGEESKDQAGVAVVGGTLNRLQAKIDLANTNDPGDLGIKAGLAGGGGTYTGPGDSVPPIATLPESSTALGVTSPNPVTSKLRVVTPSTPAPPTPSDAPASPTAPGRPAAPTEEIGPMFDSGFSGARIQPVDGDREAGEARYYFDEAGRWSTRSRGTDVIVYDGFGRSYKNHELIRYLHPLREDESPSDMFFRYYGDNPYVISARDALSTFAVDVDTASYPMARKYLKNRQLPPRSAIRTEEFLNYFKQDLTAPTEDDFAVTLQAAATPFLASANHVLLRVGVKAREVSDASRKPLNLVFVIDKSGSMREGGRLDLVKRSLELLLDQLRDDDMVGIVSFDSSGHIVLESKTGTQRWELREALRNLQPGGSTNAAEGLYLGYEMIDRHYREGAVNRVILASDGVANTGETDQQRILDRVSDFTGRQVDLSTIGVGMGNHNDVFLEQMADKGNGACHYVDDFDEAKRIFIEQFTGTMQTVARDVKIQVEFDPAVVSKWRQIGYENRSLQDNQFRDDSVDAGEVGAGHEIVALYELELRGDVAQAVTRQDSNSGPGLAPANLATVRLRWKPDVSKKAALEPTEAPTRSTQSRPQAAVEREFSLPQGQSSTNWNEMPARFRLDAVVAQYAEFMRRSYHARGDDYARLEREADRLVQDLIADNSVRELRDLIQQTRKIVRFQAPTDELWIMIEDSRRLSMLQQELHQLDTQTEKTLELMAELKIRNNELEARIREHLEKQR